MIKLTNIIKTAYYNKLDLVTRNKHLVKQIAKFK